MTNTLALFGITSPPTSMGMDLKHTSHNEAITWSFALFPRPTPLLSVEDTTAASNISCNAFAEVPHSLANDATIDASAAVFNKEMVASINWFDKVSASTRTNSSVPTIVSTTVSAATVGGVSVLPQLVDRISFTPKDKSKEANAANKP
jgi:hypothetical protein